VLPGRWWRFAIARASIAVDDESARGSVERSRSASIEAMPYFWFGALGVVVLGRLIGRGVVGRGVVGRGGGAGRGLVRSAPARYREVEVGLFDEDFGFRAERVSNFIDERMGDEPLFVAIDAPVGEGDLDVGEERAGHGEQGARGRLRLDRRSVVDARRAETEPPDVRR
jgi:hypothetical protein